jgi:hypothetical protein
MEISKVQLEKTLKQKRDYLERKQIANNDDMVSNETASDVNLSDILSM